MSNPESAVQRFTGATGFSCSQAILMTYGPALGLDEKTAAKLGSGLGGGCRTGEVCGAVSAACLILGLKHGPTGPATADHPADQAARAKTYSLVTEFMTRFQARHNHVRCQDLLGCNIATPEGMKSAQERKLFTVLCPNFVQSAAEILEKLP